MRVTYHTGIATLVQFIAMTLLSLANNVDSIVTTCVARNGDCLGNTFASVVFFLVTGLWFAFIWALGLATQQKRSRKLALLLIAIEAGVLMIAAFNLSGKTTTLSFFTSFLDICLALWVAFLAFRLIKANGSRIVVGERRRRRQPTPKL